MPETTKEAQEFNELVAPAFREVPLRVFFLYGKENQNQESFNKEYNLYIKAFLFNIIEKREDCKMDYFKFIDFYEKNVSTRRDTFTGQAFLIKNEVILEVLMSKDTSGNMFFKYTPH